ncbi:hypothetical protein GGR03_001268 [Aurantimonas endophytica]|uniref:Uncharacterized protein n=1 Tax=Aurantimonas endophytica TaxID=1522175 RepID=A0A7W6HBW1_9HYPH|nr:hypothetical protein [Aurantimonas endophytica]
MKPPPITGRRLVMFTDPLEAGASNAARQQQVWHTPAAHGMQGLRLRP